MPFKCRLTKRGLRRADLEGRLTCRVDAEAGLKLTPLHFASIDGHLGVARLLVDAGANLHAVRSDVRTPRDLAQARGRTDVAVMLDAVTTSAEERRRAWTAARPWSVARHSAFNPTVRRRAVLLLVIGRRLAAERLSDRFQGADEAFLEWWTERGVPYVLDPWGEDGGGALQDQ